MVFTDPPYNVPFPATSRPARSSTASSPWHPGDVAGRVHGFSGVGIGQLAAYSVDGAIHFQCMDWRHLPEMLAPVLPPTQI